MTEAEFDNQALQASERDDFYTKYSTPIITLSNGLRVANFSSNHEFKFVDGSILPAVSNELCTMLSMDTVEQVYNEDISLNNFKTINLVFKPSIDVLNAWLIENAVDVVIVPLPVITMMRGSMNKDDNDLYYSPFRTIRVANRLTKSICIDKFCI